jgi:general secretion pathway protein F
MATYRYTALDANGTTTHGTQSADSAKHLRQQLRQRGLHPLTLTAVTTTHTRNRLGKRISANDLALLTRQFATLISAQVPLSDALQTLSEQVDKPAIQTLLYGVRDKILEGYALADALRLYPYAFNELYCATVAAGEQTGRLDLILNRLADYTEQQQTMRRKLRMSLIYPSLMTTVSVLIVVFLLIYVVPRIISVFTDTGHPLPQMTQALIALSHGLGHYGIFGFSLIFGSAMLCQRLWHLPRTQPYLHRFIYRLPLLGSLLIRVNSARFCRTLSILLGAGVDLLKALQVATALVTLLPMQTTLRQISQKVREGRPLHLALKQSAIFDPMMIQLVANGESSGRLSDMLDYVANHQDTEINRLIDTGLALFEPGLILIMGLVVLFIVLAVLLPIFELGQILV